MTYNDPEDIQEKKERAIEKQQKSESGNATVPSKNHQGREKTVGIPKILRDVEDISSQWPTADQAYGVGGETSWKTDDPEEKTVTNYEDQNIESKESGYAEVNQILNALSPTHRSDNLTAYVQGENTDQHLGIEESKSGLTKIVDDSLEEVSESLDSQELSYRFGEDNGAIMSSSGYTNGAVPDHPLEDEEDTYNALESMKPDELEKIGSMIDTLTEDSTTRKEGKYVEAFQMYTGEKTQTQIAEHVGLDQSTLSLRAKEWKEKGLVENTDQGIEYTEPGQALNQMIDNIYYTR